jgi:hypothetical protein
MELRLYLKHRSQGPTILVAAAERDGAVGFINWLGRVWTISPIATENEFWNAGEGDTANNCYGANPFPSERSKREKSKPVSEGSKSTKNKKRAGEAAVDAAASGSVKQT